jgi:hypothetical protein
MAHGPKIDELARIARVGRKNMIAVDGADHAIAGDGRIAGKTR